MASFASDSQIEFRALQRDYYPDLTRKQWTDLFMVWALCDTKPSAARKAAMHTRMEELVEEHRNLIVERSFLPPSRRAAANERIAEISEEIAQLYAPPPPSSPLGNWG